MFKMTSFLSALVLLAGCGNNWCALAICGCWSDQTFREEISVTDTESQPASSMSLVCETSQKTYGITDESGIVKARIEGRSSLGCGIAAECVESTLRDPDGNIVAIIDVTQLLRGQEITAGEYRLKVIRDGD